MGKLILTRLAAIAAGGVLALAAVAPASAADDPTGEIDLSSDHVDKTAGGAEQECTGPLDDLGQGLDGWHFVLPASSGDAFVKLNLTFAMSGGGTVPVEITSTDSGSPSTGSEWSGWIDNAGSSEVDKHAYLTTSSGWTLTAGTAEVTNPAEDGRFNLSHACAPSPTPSPSSSETPTSSPSSSESSSPSDDSESPSPDEDGGLPVTGTAVGGAVVLGVGLLAAGIAMMAVRRRDLPDLTEEA